MLACRPMLSFAVAAMAGVLACRSHPGIALLLPAGFLTLLVLILLHWRAKPRPVPLPAAPYAAHLHPVPGPLARRGLNRFILLACLAVFLLGVQRQTQWRETVASSRLPEAAWFRASLVADAPNRDYPGQRGRWRVPATLFLVDGKGVADISVHLQGSDDVVFRRGDIVQARVRRLPSRPPAFPGAFDAAFFLERAGAAAALGVVRTGRGGGRAPSLDVVPVDAASPYLTLRRWLDALRGLAIRRTLDYGGEHGGMLAAMLYGYRKETAAGVQGAFRRVGIGHILAISGLHVGMIVGMLWWLAGRIGWPGRWRAAACLVLSLLYLGLSGGAVAATRATLMADIHLAGLIRGRGGDMLNSLGAAALGIVLANPTAPLDIGFQLSFTAVVFIYIALRRLPADDARADPASRAASPFPRRARRELLSLARLSVATSVGLFPIIAVVFNQVNLIGVVINIAVIPLMALVLAGGLLLPWLGWIPGAAWALTLLGRGIVQLAVACDRLPGSSFAAHGPSLAWTGVFYGCVALWLLRPMLAAGTARRRLAVAAVAGACVAAAGMAFSMRSRPAPAGGRIVLLPGRNMGSMVVEAGNGDVAVLGDIRRGGLAEAEWLHYQRRGGRAAVVAAGRAGAEAFGELAYHAGLAGVTPIAPTRKAEAGAATAWLPVPGAEGVEYAYRRDGRGRLFWLSARADGVSATAVSRIGAERFAALAAEGVPGSDAAVISLGFSDDAPALPAGFAAKGVVGVGGRMPRPAPERFFRRAAYGAVVADADGVRGFDGAAWVRP